MVVVQSFDNFDDMMNAISKGVESAKARMTPEQEAITYGDYWMRVWEGIPIFGYIIPRDELEASERELGATDEEIEYENDVLDASYANGFRFGRAYSVMEPDGELGDTHVIDMIPITKEQFEEAKSLGWGEGLDNIEWYHNIIWHNY